MPLRPSGMTGLTGQVSGFEPCIERGERFGWVGTGFGMCGARGLAGQLSSVGGVIGTRGAGSNRRKRGVRGLGA